jgi:hypothetical protein
VATLASNASHSWAARSYSTLSFDWAGTAGSGKVSVKLGDAAATSYAPPKAGINVNQQAGKLTNNTDKTITYTLS